MRCCCPEKLHGGGRGRFSSRPGWHHRFTRGESGVEKQLWKYGGKSRKHLWASERCIQNSPSHTEANLSRGENQTLRTWWLCATRTLDFKGKLCVGPLAGKGPARLYIRVRRLPPGWRCVSVTCDRRENPLNSPCEWHREINLQWWGRGVERASLP